MNKINQFRIRLIARQFLLLFITILLASHLFAQPGDSIPPPYKRYPSLPPFELRALDGSLIKRDELPARKATILVFFSPDCHHCLEQTEQFKSNLRKLGKYNLVFATYQPMEELKTFYEKNKMNKWKNLYIGRDEKYFLPPFYRISNLPYIALYNQKGELIRTYEGPTILPELLQNFDSSTLPLTDYEQPQ